VNGLWLEFLEVPSTIQEAAKFKSFILYFSGQKHSRKASSNNWLLSEYVRNLIPNAKLGGRA
jgi:hypothetical protein